MKPTTAYLLGGVIAIVCVAIGVYYLIPIPNGTHLLASTVDAADVKHALVFFGLAVVALVGARFAANTKPTR
jgi:hypothetical protein